MILLNNECFLNEFVFSLHQLQEIKILIARFFNSIIKREIKEVEKEWNPWDEMAEH